jgi:hypothetical protein
MSHGHISQWQKCADPTGIDQAAKRWPSVLDHRFGTDTTDRSYWPAMHSLLKDTQSAGYLRAGIARPVGTSTISK